MKPSLAFVCGAAAISLLSMAFAPQPAAAAPQDPQDAMKQAAKFTRPGPNHKVLERFLGSWRTKTAFVMGGKKTPPTDGETVFRWQMQGRWLIGESKGSMMGMPYESCWLLGHDNFKQCFVCTTVQNLDTAMLRSQGHLTQDGKTLILYGQMDEYLTGHHDKTVKYVFRFVDADTITVEVHDLHIGEQDTQVLEIAMQRA